MDELHQLREENERLKQENQELRERLTLAEAKIKQLVDLLGQNSHNSSWPSSRDKVIFFSGWFGVRRGEGNQRRLR